MLEKHTSWNVSVSGCLGRNIRDQISLTLVSKPQQGRDEDSSLPMCLTCQHVEAPCAFEFEPVVTAVCQLT